MDIRNENDLIDDQKIKMWELGYSHGFLNLLKQKEIRFPEYILDYESGFEAGKYDLDLYLSRYRWINTIKVK